MRFAEMNLQQIERLKECRQQAFTARIDLAEDTDLRTFYIGKHKIERIDERVFVG